MTDESVDTERAVVKTYVPRYQKERWREEADGMDMSQSEFLRTMVQAGRRGFDFGNGDAGSPEARFPPSNPRSDGLETRLLDVLETDTYATWDELVELLSENFEEELEDALNQLRERGRIEHSPRHGGFALAEGGDE